MAQLLDSILPYLPQEDGLLPKWLFLVGVVAMMNSAQAYATLEYTSRVYCGSAAAPRTKSDGGAATAYASSSSHVNGLSGRTFGTWTVIQSLVRLYAAYDLANPALYQLAMWTNAVAFAHFTSEWFVFKSTHWGTPLAGPILVSTGSLIWMTMQYNYYVK